MSTTWEALSREPPDHTPFLVEPYIPRGGIILLHGKYSTGKSPLTWNLARCVGEGQPWFGCPTTPGRVLYLELDMPRTLLKKRLAGVEPACNVWWEIRNPYPPIEKLVEVGREVKPDLVIVNTLRKCYTGSDIESHAPSLIYTRYQLAFPAAAILFVHHDRKDYRGPGTPGNEDENFAGSQAWMNDAQVGLHVQAVWKDTFRITHTKSQVSALAEPLTFHLVNGQLGPGLDERVSAEWPTAEGTTKTERVKATALKLGVSERSVWGALSRASAEPLQKVGSHGSEL